MSATEGDGKREENTGDVANTRTSQRCERKQNSFLFAYVQLGQICCFTPCVHKVFPRCLPLLLLRTTTCGPVAPLLVKGWPFCLTV